jgi:hypothetical protein
MITAAEHPLVRTYLAQLDRALVVLPKAQAAELREQISAHLEEALHCDSDDTVVRTVLDNLGSPDDLVAEVDSLSNTVVSGGGHRSRLRQVKARTWVVVLIVVALAVAGLVTAAVQILPRYRAGSLVCVCGMGWSDPADASKQVLTRANGREQSTVPMRAGGGQGIDIEIVNPTRFTQTVLGLPTEADGFILGPLGPRAHYRLQMTSSNSPTTGMTSVGLSDHFPIAIPAGATATIRLEWGELTCYSKGGGVLINDIPLRVRVGWFARTETINLGVTFALIAATTTPCPQTVTSPSH